MGKEEPATMESREIEEYFSYFANVQTEMVKPASAGDHPASLYPSHLDHLHMDRYVPILTAYRLADKSDSFYRQFVDGLKESLAKALVLFYPVAGAVIRTSDPHHPRMLVCDDRGVPFTEAYKDENMDDIVKANEIVPPLQGLEAAGLYSVKQCQEVGGFGIPCFLFQVTRFKCGGVSIAVNWNHLVADMAGAMSFVRAWADLARKGETTIVPQLDRAVLDPRHGDGAESELTNPPPFTAEEKAKLAKVLNSEYTLGVLDMKTEKIDKVKREALQQGFVVSTMDCVCAHVWRCISRYYADAGISDTTIFSTAVEGRAKMGDILTPHYFGNVIVPAFIRNVPASEILSKPLAYAAGLIRKSITEITPETYWNIIDQMDLANPWKTAINRVDYQLGAVSWMRFGLFDLDFGQGKPLCFHLNMRPQVCRKGQCIILPSNGGPGDFRLLYFSSPRTIERLWADPEFMSLS